MRFTRDVLNSRILRTLLSACLVCLMGFVLLDCGTPADCDASKACPAGQRCDAGKCVAVTNRDGGGKDDSKPADQTSDSVGPTDSPDGTTSDQSTDTPPSDKPPGLTIYRWRKAGSSTQADLYGISMPSDTHAWAVGSKGTILHSSDSGGTWTAQSSAVTSTLYTVWFVDEKNGYAGGEGGVLVKTGDGGKTWEKISSVTNEAIRRIQFISEQTGYAVGDGFAFLATRDGGRTWQPQSQQLTFNLNGMSFRDRLTGYVVGSGGLIFYTRDAGTKITTVVTGTLEDFYGIHFPDNNNGWAVGKGGVIVKSDNRGESWVKGNSGTKEDLHQVFFLTAKRGWIIGTNGAMFGTRDSGGVWRKEVDQPYPDLHDMSIRSEKLGVIVGKGGTILWLKPEKGECAPGAEQACYTGPAATKDVGICLSGKQVCDAGAWGPCIGEVLPEPKEVCFNAKDDNCNGKDDQSDGCPACKDNDTTACYTGPMGTQGVGECRSGVKVCTNGAFGACEQETQPKDELCNGKDDNCDGKVDNDILDKNKPACTLFYGICATAKRSCIGGKWIDCKEADYGADYQKTEDKCDGKDNDCDDAVDEGCACTKDGDSRKCYNGPAGTLDVGTCAAGAQTCTSGKWTTCQSMVKPVREVCTDQKDNDCDKITDEVNQYSLNFNSQKNAHIIVADDAALKPTKGLTLEGWFYFLGLGTRNRQRALISKAESGGYGLYVDWPKGGDISLRVWPTGGTAYTVLTKQYKGIMSTRKWIHLAGTYDGTNLRLFVNGKEIGSMPFSKDIGYSTKTIPLFFGAEAGDGGIARSAMLFYGNIAQIRVAGKALYTADFKPECNLKDSPDAIGFWSMDEGTGDTLKDAKGKHDGTNKAATWSETIRCAGFNKGGCRP